MSCLRTVSSVHSHSSQGWLGFPCFCFVLFSHLSKYNFQSQTWSLFLNSYSLDYPCHNSLPRELVWSRYMTDISAVQGWGCGLCWGGDPGSLLTPLHLLYRWWPRKPPLVSAVPRVQLLALSLATCTTHSMTLCSVFIVWVKVRRWCGTWKS